MSQSAADFVRLLGLDEDDLEDVEDELSTCTDAWKSSIIPDNVIYVTGSADQSVLDRLFKKVKIGTILPAQIEALRKLAGSEGKLTEDMFSTWYLTFIFKGEEDEVDEEEREFKTSGGLLNQLLPKDGEAWRCVGCRVVNSWSERKCIACDNLAPHAATLPNEAQIPVTSSTGGFTFGTPANASSAGVFTFGTAPTKSTSDVSNTTGGFVFGGGGTTVSFGGSTVQIDHPKK